MGEQYRGRVQPMLGEHLLEPVQHTDTGIDDDALLARGGGHHVAIGVEGRGRKAGDEHDGASLLTGYES